MRWTKRIGRVWGAAVVAVVMLAAGVTGVVVTGSGGAGAQAPTPPGLSSGTLSTLALRGLDLVPAAVVAKVDETAAISAAVRAAPVSGPQVREAQLVIVHGSSRPSLDGRVVWAISIMPGSGVYAGMVGEKVRVTSMVLFVDPSSGKALAMMGEGQPES